MKGLLAIFLSCVVCGCGRASFSVNTDVSDDVNVPVVSLGTDYYVEVGEEFSDSVVGQVTLTNVQFFSQAAWPGSSSLPLELRLTFSGTAGVGETRVSATAPAAWANGVEVLNATIPGGATQAQLASGNLRDVAPQILANGKFWIVGRVRYSGLELGRILKLSNLYVHAEGEKSLQTLAPLVNLGF